MHDKTEHPPVIDIFHGLRNHTRPMMWTFSLVMLVALAMTFLVPKTYTSEAKLFVRLGRESVALDPTAQTDQMVAVSEPRENEINSVFELFKSRAVLRGVVDSLDPQLVLGKGKDKGEDEVQTASVLPWANLFQPYSIEDAALKHLSQNLDIKVIKKSKIINISYDADSPELARDVVAEVIAQGRDAHVRVNRTEGSQEFFAAQVERLRTTLHQLEEQLRQLKNNSGVTSLVDQRVMKLEQITALQNSLWKAEADLRASTAEWKAHQDIAKRTPAMIEMSRTVGMPHSAVEAMREQFYSLQVREQELLSKFTEDHPHVRAISEQVKGAREVLKDELSTEQIAKGSNPAHQQLHVAMVESEAQTASLEAQASALREQLVPLRQELNQLNDHELEISRLEREIELERDSYIKYAENLEQSRIDRELEMSDISNLNVLQAPTFSITPTRPRVFLNLVLGFIGASAAAFGVGLFAEQRQRGAVAAWLAPRRGIVEAAPTEAHAIAPAAPEGHGEPRV